jgi:hypothetical protein
MMSIKPVKPVHPVSSVDGLLDETPRSPVEKEALYKKVMTAIESQCFQPTRAMSNGRIEFDSYGNYRINLGLPDRVGEWVAHHEIAFLWGKHATYMAFSDYWEGKFPTNKLMMMMEAPK